MSTLKRTSHLLCVSVALAICLSGCASTPKQQSTGPLSKMKTYLAVGEKPLPVVTGEPGSTISAAEPSDVDPPSPRPARKPDGRISGRVYDSEGRPVPEARVRLAVNGASGGKVVKTSTDRSGAFTLHGLRANSDYTLIAEWEGEDGPERGRATASTDESDDRISLAPQDESKTVHAAIPARVRRVSEQGEIDANDPEPPNLPRAVEADDQRTSSHSSTKPRSVVVNEEDLPPAQEAEKITEDSRVSKPASRRRLPPTAAIGSSVWRSSQNPKPKSLSRDTPAVEPEPSKALVDPETRGTSAPLTALDDEDGPNPLPPAIERAEDPLPTPGLQTFSEPPPEPLKDPFTSPDPFPAMTKTQIHPSRVKEDLSATQRPEYAPGSVVVAPQSFGPVVFQDDPFASEPPPRVIKKSTSVDVPETSRPIAKRTNSQASRPKAMLAQRELPKGELVRPGSTPAPDDFPVVKAPASRTPRKPTWGDLSQRGKELPPLESDSLVASGQPDFKADPGVARRSLRVRPTGKGETVQAVLRSETMKSRTVETSCEYDDRHRRIVDFRLPDVDGKPVTFKDIDADLVLLDFWGTWCQPCLRSVPHLVDLQERMGKRIAVVGIACEPDPRDQALARVKATALKFKVNYPILVSKNDGTCPLQEALHIQAFPTLILVDREGRVIWRDQGATPATLARLDRALALSPKADSVRRN